MQNLPLTRELADATAFVADRGEVPLLLVRHGRTASNVEQRFVGRMDVPLDEVGHREVARLARRLAPLPRAALYASPLTRALQTAAPLGEAERVDALQELDQGELEGLLVTDALPRHPRFFQAWREDPTHVRVPGGETLGECQARGLAALEAIARRHGPGPAVVVVSHKMLLCTAVMGVLGLPLRGFRHIPMVNTAISLMGWHPDRGLRLLRFNDSRHLRDAPSRSSAIATSRAPGTS